MQSAAFDHNSTQRTGRVTAAERYKQLCELFDRVTETYVKIRSYPTVIAVDPDPDPIARSNKWTPNLAHFLCDVELVTDQALKDAPDLQAGWFKLAAGDPVDPQIEKEIVTRCGRLYRARGIDPTVYFRKIPRGGAR